MIRGKVNTNAKIRGKVHSIAEMPSTPDAVGEGRRQLCGIYGVHLLSSTDSSATSPSNALTRVYACCVLPPPPPTAAQLAATLRRASTILNDELKKGESAVAIDHAAQQVLAKSREVATALRRDKRLTFSFEDASDTEYHETVGKILLAKTRRPPPPSAAVVPDRAVEAMLEAYSNLATVCNTDMFRALVDSRHMLNGLVGVIDRGASGEVVHAVFLLSQLALLGPVTAQRIALLPGITQACCKGISAGSREAGSSAKSESLALNTALMVNNVSALGGEEAIKALTSNGELIRELGSWLDNAHDAETLQRLTGVFNHLSRSLESARALHTHGIMQALHRLVTRRVAGSVESHEAYLGLAHMAIANIAVRQNKEKNVSIEATHTQAVKSIVGFLKLAIEGRHLNGIHFRVYDVLFALDSLCKYKERDLLGIECGLVDLAVQVTAEWTPGKYSSIFSDAKASTHPVLEVRAARA